MKSSDDRGSIMMETALVLPIFVIIIFFIIQITFVWVAKQMTYYAAYCGARAALVYNPADYGAVQQKDGHWETAGLIRSGVVHHAACAVLSWISWSLGGYDLTGGRGLYYYLGKEIEFLNFKIGGMSVPGAPMARFGGYSVPLSSNIRNQVAVEVKEFEKIKDKETNNGDEEPAAVEEQFPAVTCRVSFRCPLFIPLGGQIVAYFFGANDQRCIATYETEGTGENERIIKDSISVGGFNALNGKDVHDNLVMRGNYTEIPESYYTTDTGEKKKRRYKSGFYNIVLEESCTMAKPYKTDTYPLMPKADKEYLGMWN